MKILHILDHSLPIYDGYSFRSQNIFQEQRKRGWIPVIVTSPKHEQYWKGNRTGRQEINGFTYYRTGGVYKGMLPFEEEIRLILNLGNRIYSVAKFEKPDILHAHSPILNAIPAIWVGHRLKIPVVYEIRAFWEDAAADQGTYEENSLKYRMVRALENWVCRKADQVVVLCEGLKRDLIQRGIPADKMTVMYNGINQEDFSCNEPDPELAKILKTDGKRVIGFIGSFYHFEGLDLLVKAFSRLEAKHPNVVLVLVGGGEMEDKLRKQVGQLGLNEKVIMPGRIPHDRVPGIYALVDVLAYPRYSMRLTNLVTPLKPLEAMAMGKALVASDVGGHKELIRHEETGLLFPAGNACALVEALSLLLENSSLREKIEKKSFDWVRNEHTWEKTTAVYEDIYKKALGR